MVSCASTVQKHTVIFLIVLISVLPICINATMMKAIPEAIAHVSHKWQLTDLRPLVAFSPTRNYVARAYSALYQTDVVLKILIEDTREPQVLRLFDGNGCVKLLEYDQEHNVLLMENIIPGTRLSTLFPHDDMQSLEIMASLVKKMQHTDIRGHEEEFPNLEQWMEEMYACKSTKIPQVLLHKAYALSQELLCSKQPRHLLHGDLHHKNIVQCADNPLDSHSWIIIDPKGVIGPLEFEVVRFLMNPIPALLEQPNPKEIIQHRIKRLHEIFGFKKERLRNWLFVQAVLAACWASESEDYFFNYFMRVVQLVGEEL